ncbi:MAG TPA: ubiquinol-cytochrome c reductase iron-sulfur subunit [bacterium]|nr:ubiquinol-cytochrome c reductase iron-sulfur subunit [bacterium]
MTSCRSTWHRSFLTFLISLVALPALAEGELPQTATTVSNIANLGALLACGLFAYAGFLTVRFLLRNFQEFRKAKQAHGHGEGPGMGSIFQTGLLWVGTLFAVVGAGSLFFALLSADAGLKMTSFKVIVEGVSYLAVAIMGLGLLYLAVLSVAALVPKREKHEEASEAPVESIPLNPEFTRRSFLSLLGWAWVAFVAATMGALTTMLRFAFPNVTFEPPLKFKAGFPDTFNMGVDERHKNDHKVWIVRNDQGFYALSTICTHLGCTPNWLQAEQKFKCPCHGSGYYITGVNFEGPAPRPLPRFNIVLADDGQIQIDESIQYQQELGQWGLPGSFLNYKA